jgi:hypothetical protein
MRLWLLFAALILVVPPVAAQSVLPTRFAGWQAVPGSSRAVVPKQLPQAQAAVLQNCREQSAEYQSYQRNGAQIGVTLYSMRSPSWGYSAFSLLRPVPATSFRPTQHSSIGSNQAMMLVGNLLVDVTGKSLATHGKDFVSLAQVLQAQASAEPYPTLWQYLPAKDFVPHSDRYALNPQTLDHALAETGAGTWGSGDWLGFYDSAEAEVGQYNVAGRRVTLLLASYPTHQLAAEHLKDMEKWFDINPAPGAPKTARVLYARRIGSVVGMVDGAGSAAQANGLLAQIHYQTVVTWNEPSFMFHQLTMPEYIVGIITGTGVILLITLVVGIALGMIRIGVKRFFPGVIFDRRRSVEVIQLGLTSKPIDPTDFY